MATLYGGSLRLHTPLVFTVGFLCLFTFGGLTGVVLSNASIDIAVHDTVFYLLFAIFIFNLLILIIATKILFKHSFSINNKYKISDLLDKFNDNNSSDLLNKINYNEYIKIF
jgi:heme/copper-type cytochrome/quinol oxidase subunit 1